jgi:hypothetical protein
VAILDPHVVMHGTGLRKRHTKDLLASHRHGGSYALGMLNAHNDSARCQKELRVNVHVLACKIWMCPLMPVTMLVYI